MESQRTADGGIGAAGCVSAPRAFRSPKGRCGKRLPRPASNCGAARRVSTPRLARSGAKQADRLGLKQADRPSANRQIGLFYGRLANRPIGLAYDRLIGLMQNGPIVFLEQTIGPA